METNIKTTQYTFPKFPESELFKFYFTSLRDIDRNIHNINLNITNGTVNKNITSITHILQFINMGKVVEEISVICEYSPITDNIRILFIKHFEANKLTIAEEKEIYEQRRVGFPKTPFIFSNDILISFTRIDDQDFLIKILNNDITYGIGIVSFKNVANNSKVNIEPLVKCIIKTKDDITNVNIDDITFTLIAPTMNKGQIIARLTNQYRLAICNDIYNNIIHFYDIGIVRIMFYNNNASVYSLTSVPKIKMNSILTIENDVHKYIFKGNIFVY